MGTPLGTMAILIGEIQDECESGENPELAEKMRILREQVGRCKQALSIMSATAGEIRAESGRIKSLTSYIDELIADWRHQRPDARLSYRKSGPKPAPDILAEQTLTHALINILNNASEVSPEGVELRVRWTYAAITLVILDRGPGLAPGLIDQIGKSPVSTKESGLGVGLFLAFATINRLGGTIEMVSREKGGIRTTIVLPVVGKMGA
jgi:two-component system sensor histidine kinase RegB